MPWRPCSSSYIIWSKFLVTWHNLLFSAVICRTAGALVYFLCVVGGPAELTSGSGGPAQAESAES